MKVKVLYSSVQLIVNMPYLLKLDFPYPFNSMMNSLSWVNFAFFGNMGISCHFRFDYLTELVVTTLAAIVVALLLVLVGMVQFRVCVTTMQYMSF